MAEAGKLLIAGFKKDPLEGGSDPEPDKKFIAQINPEKFSFSRSISSTKEKKPIKADGAASQVQGAGLATLNFDLMFDGTGVIDDKTDVEKKLQELQDVVYNYEGEIHAPLFVRVTWNKFIFYAHLKTLNIECSLFDTTGHVLRAKASLSFTEYRNNKRTDAESWNRSPDLTHIKTVRIGDTITQFCKNIYDDPNYYTEIAKVNELVNFRNLKLGSQLFFPPLEK